MNTSYCGGAEIGAAELRAVSQTGITENIGGLMLIERRTH